MKTKLERIIQTIEENPEIAVIGSELQNSDPGYIPKGFMDGDSSPTYFTQYANLFVAPVQEIYDKEMLNKIGYEISKSILEEKDNEKIYSPWSISEYKNSILEKRQTLWYYPQIYVNEIISKQTYLESKEKRTLYLENHSIDLSYFEPKFREEKTSLDGEGGFTASLMRKNVIDVQFFPNKLMAETAIVYNNSFTSLGTYVFPEVLEALPKIKTKEELVNYQFACKEYYGQKKLFKKPLSEFLKKDYVTEMLNSVCPWKALIDKYEIK